MSFLLQDDFVVPPDSVIGHPGVEKPIASLALESMWFSVDDEARTPKSCSTSCSSIDEWA